MRRGGPLQKTAFARSIIEVEKGTSFGPDHAVLERIRDPDPIEMNNMSLTTVDTRMTTHPMPMTAAQVRKC